MDSAHSPQTRRQFLRRIGAAGAVGAVGVEAVPSPSPVGQADALACGGLCVAAGAATGGAVAGWLLREYQVLGSNPPAEGLTPDALKSQVYQTAQTRQSTNASTFIDNQNILDGLTHVAYSDGKMSGIEALNAQETQATVLDNARAAADSQFATVQANLASSWNESANELISLVSTIKDHPDLSVSDVFDGDGYDLDFPDHGSISSIDDITVSEKTITLADGTEHPIQHIEVTFTEDGSAASHPLSGKSFSYDLTGRAGGDTDGKSNIQVTAGDGITYLSFADWNDLWTTIDSQHSDVSDGLSLWVDKIYGKVQAGDLDTSDLLTPKELAEITSKEESKMNQAVADLMALNVSVNLDREAKISIPSHGTTLYGSLGVTGEKTINAGTTIDPSSDDNDYYLTYDVSESHGTWDAVESAVDGGIVTFTKEPYPGMIWSINTGAGETAEVSTSDLSDNGDGTWTVNISGQVEMAITTVDNVDFYSQVEETQTETVLLDETFTVEEFTDESTGETHDSASYERPSEPETDNNYITQEEFEQRDERLQELIDKYEKQQNSGGLGLPSVGGIPGEGLIGGVIAIMGGAWALGQVSN